MSFSEKNILEPEKWIDRYGDILFNYTITRINKREVAEDLVQETFFSAYKARESFQQEASEKTWLIAILKRKIIDHYRKKSTQNELSVFDKDSKDDFVNYFFDKESGNGGHWADSSAPQEWRKDFQTSVESDEFNAILKNCLGKLSEKTSAVFTLKNMEDLDSDEICKELQITASNYWVLMHRAKLQLRECMEKNWFLK
ncbi:MAG: sigma-70 family RNA polymerase sigma factor [Bacteroidetes bacterium]|nr:sigma-70 family RNA polymerase sigma factor [Bacteroidota bacterium]